MGDGPGYDHLAHTTGQAQIRKAKAQDERINKLYDILASCGFGDSDGENTKLEDTVVRKLYEAYDLLGLIKAARRRS